MQVPLVRESAGSLEGVRRGKVIQLSFHHRHYGKQNERNRGNTLEELSI
jgi:hypothetical protein